jgi:hypothetical protein
VRRFYRARDSKLAREARLLAALTHPRIAAIYGFEHLDGVHFLVLELAAGESLAERLSRGPLPLAEAVGVARQIADGLEAAHEKGIVHRDLKPGNVQLAPDGQVKVLDFGLAKAFVADPASVDSSESPTVTSGGTRYGVILGTAAYMSPEQARGQALDKRTDVWAFGCVLYECLTGARAFPGLTVSDTIAAVLEREPEWNALPARTPASVGRLLQRCLRKDARVRLRDIADARLELEGDPPAAAGTTVSSGPRARPALRWGAALAALALVASGGWWLGVRQAGSAAPRQPRLTRLTWDGGVATDPALSPDGTLVAYASNRGDESNLDLWVQRVAGGTPIRLTRDPADDDEPSFSPDGSTIAFRSNRDGGGIYVMPALGGDARLLARGGHDPRFSPDGSSLAYWTGPWLGGQILLGTAIFVVPAIGGEARPVAAGLAAARNPVWAPDGKSLVFLGRGAGTAGPEAPDWWWVSLDGRPLVATGAFRTFDAAGVNTRGLTTFKADMLPSAWTAEGVWAGAEIEQSVKIFRLAISPQTGAVVGAPLQVTSGTGHDASPSVDRQGRVAFRASLNTAAMCALPLDANAGRVKAAGVRLASDAGEGVHRGSVDPAGRVLVFPKHRPTESELWLKDLRTGQEMLYLLLEPDGFRCLHAVPVDPARGVQIGPPFVVHHFHDPQRWLSSTPFGSGIVKDAFIYDQFEITASIWLLDPSPGAESARRD